MTDLAPALTAEDARAVGDAAVSGLAAVPGLQVEPVPADAGVPLPDEATAVAVDLGTGARAVLAVAPALARQVQVGPPPADDVVAGCTPALEAVAAAVGATPASGPAEVAPTAAQAGPDELVVAARLVDDSGHVATVAVVVPASLATPSAADADAPVHEFAPLPAGGPAIADTGLEILHDVALGVTAELGRTSMLVKEVLSLAPGSVIELDRAAGSPVDVLVNGTLIARGEVVVIDEEFGIRITEVIGYAESTKP